jgi:hypothetical protein
MVIDGVLCNGDDRQNDGGKDDRGWVYLPPKLGVLGGCQLEANVEAAAVTLTHLKVYPRQLLTSEMIGAWRAGNTAEMSAPPPS